MVDIIRKEARLIAILGISISLSLILSYARIKMSDSISYTFLIWNLILAGIPLVIALIANHKFKILKTWMLLGLLGLWLLFFPNSPYIITDIFHLKPKQGIPLWYDLFLIFSYAWNGLILGFYSLWHMQEVVKRRWNKGIAWCFSFVSLFMAGFGVYLGRYLRWNSWDILTHPEALAIDIVNRIIHPFEHGSTWGVTLILSSFLIIAYFSISHFGYLQYKSKIDES
ncbi:MAG: DUF1361 domain-containing protein [Bacteroidota bacterium]